VEEKRIRTDDETRALGDAITQVPNLGQLHIRHRATADAPNVFVGVWHAVESRRRAAAAELVDQTTFFENAERPVDGGETDVGNAPTSLLVDPLRRGVIEARSYDIEHDHPLRRTAETDGAPSGGRRLFIPARGRLRFQGVDSSPG
jgi:hypothetical protein